MCNAAATEEKLQVRQPIAIQREQELASNRQTERFEQAEQAQQAHQAHQIQAVEPLIQLMQTHAQIDTPAPLLRQKESRSERKKREQLESARQKAEEQRQVVLRQEQARNRQPLEGDQQFKEERALFAAKLKAVALEEKAGLKAAEDSGEIAALEVRHQAQAERAKLAGEFARMLPLGSAQRRKAMAAKEEAELKADHLRRKLKVARMPDGEEKKREQATLKRHGNYDNLKKIFRQDNPLSHEDAKWTLPDQTELVNVGRAFFGGTKPMYIFEDRSTPILRDGQVVGYKQYLFKEATNCIGIYKPEGALVTEAAAALQGKICGPYSIPAYAAVRQDGKVLGSFQEKIETNTTEQRVDLFSWQANPQDVLSADMKKEILREHTLDWLLCNFDTKGENFLHRTDNHLCSFDKEASFSKLKDAGAEHMSSDYKPHANDTLYNTLFTQFAEGKMTLDLSASLEQVDKVERMQKEEYMGIFSKMLEQKYGPAGLGNKARAEVENAIWQRKSCLREEYRTFYTSLIARRRDAMARNGLGDDCKAFTDERGKFRFADEVN